jgi:hypothetical protein
MRPVGLRNGLNPRPSGERTTAVRTETEKNRRARAAWDEQHPRAVLAFQTEHHVMAQENEVEMAAESSRFQARVDASAAATHPCSRACTESGRESCLVLISSRPVERHGMSGVIRFTLPTYKCTDCSAADVTPSSWQVGCAPSSALYPRMWFCWRLMEFCKLLHQGSGVSVHGKCVGDASP